MKTFQNLEANASPQSPGLKLLRIRDLTEAFGISKSYIYKLSKDGKFPKPVPLIEGGNAVGWIAEEVQEWLDERIAAREEGDV